MNKKTKEKKQCTWRFIDRSRDKYVHLRMRRLWSKQIMNKNDCSPSLHTILIINDGKKNREGSAFVLISLLDLFSFALKKKKIKRRKNFVLYHIISIENNSHLLKWKYLTFVYETSYYVSLVNDYNANMFNRLCWCWHLLLFFLSSSSPPSSKRRERESPYEQNYQKKKRTAQQ